MTQEDQFFKYTLALTVAIPILFVWIGSFVFSLIVGIDLNFVEELGPRLLQTLIIVAPYVVILLFGKSRLSTEGHGAFRGLNWALTLITLGTIILWGYYFYDGLSYQLGNQRGGANIGLGLLLMVSPILLCLLIPIGYRLGQEK